MENASKALVMAGGVLIGVLILSLAVYLFADFGSTSARINAQNAERQITQFNSQFTSYEGKNGLTIYDVLTVAEYARENNKYYEDVNDEYDINVYLQNENLCEIEDFEKLKQKLIKDDQNKILENNPNLPTYECSIEKYNTNGRIKEMKFVKK